MTHVVMRRGARKPVGLRGLLSLSLREFRVRDGAFLCLSDWLCDEGGTGIAELIAVVCMGAVGWRRAVGRGH